MARKSAETATVVEETTAAPVEIAVPSPAAPVRARRTRRRRGIDYAQQNQAIVAALLTSRGARGATQAQVEKAVLWGRAVHTEAAELTGLAKRPRLLKSTVSAERIAASDLNRALLDGVLSGAIALDVDEAGELVFVRA